MTEQTEAVPAAHDDNAADVSTAESVVIGNRLCTRCAFNLIGQPIEREPEYDLPVAWCPHCGKATPFEEYPPLGHWQNRLAMLAAAMWMFILIVIALGGTAFIVGISIGGVVETTELLEREIRQQADEWFKTKYPTSPPRRFQQDDYFAEFWAESGEAILAEQGDLVRFIELDELPILIIPTFAAIVLGAFWSIALIQWRRRPLLVAAWIGLMLLIAIVGVIWIWLKSIEMVNSEHVSFVVLRMPMLAAVLTIIGVVFMVALAFGRSIVRGLVRVLLPPAFRGSLSILWTAEGYEPPSPSRHVMRRRGIDVEKKP